MACASSLFNGHSDCDCVDNLVGSLTANDPLQRPQEVNPEISFENSSENEGQYIMAGSSGRQEHPHWFRAVCKCTDPHRAPSRALH